MKGVERLWLLADVLHALGHLKQPPSAFISLPAEFI
jgi:hypothetical protein